MWLILRNEKILSNGKPVNFSSVIGSRNMTPVVSLWKSNEILWFRDHTHYWLPWVIAKSNSFEEILIRRSWKCPRTESSKIRVNSNLLFRKQFIMTSTMSTEIHNNCTGERFSVHLRNMSPLHLTKCWNARVELELMGWYEDTFHQWQSKAAS